MCYKIFCIDISELDRDIGLSPYLLCCRCSFNMAVSFTFHHQCMYTSQFILLDVAWLYYSYLCLVKNILRDQIGHSAWVRPRALLPDAYHYCLLLILCGYSLWRDLLCDVWQLIHNAKVLLFWLLKGVLLYFMFAADWWKNSH